jgi:hypothetical protein
MTAAQRLNSNLEHDPVISYVKLTDSGGIETPLDNVKRSVLNRVIPLRVNLLGLGLTLTLTLTIINSEISVAMVIRVHKKTHKRCHWYVQPICGSLHGW